MFLYFPYCTDAEQEITVRIDYKFNAESRLEMGDFDPDNSQAFCSGLVLERRLLKPRQVILLTEERRVMIVVRTLDKYIELITNPERDEGKIIRAYGEVNNAVVNLADS